MTKYWNPSPLFSPNFFLTKMAQNGLKWILNITLKTVKFFISDSTFFPLIGTWSGVGLGEIWD